MEPNDARARARLMLDGVAEGDVYVDPRWVALVKDLCAEIDHLRRELATGKSRKVEEAEEAARFARLRIARVLNVRVNPEGCTLETRFIDAHVAIVGMRVSIPENTTSLNADDLGEFRLKLTRPGIGGMGLLLNAAMRHVLGARIFPLTLLGPIDATVEPLVGKFTGEMRVRVELMAEPR